MVNAEMRKIILFLVFCLALPAAAQKNMLPAVKAVVGKTALQTAVKTPALPALATGATFALPVGQGAPVSRHFALKDLFSAQTGASDASAGLLKSFSARGYERELKENDLQRLQKFINTYAEIERLKITYSSFDYSQLFSTSFFHMTVFSPLAIQNNQIVLHTLNHYIQKMKWLQQNTNLAKEAFVKGADPQHQPQGAEGGSNVFAQLARQLSQEKLIMLGEYHFVPAFQRAVVNLVLTLKKQNPNRRVVLFTEFIPLPKEKSDNGQTLATYYKHFTAPEIQPLAATDQRLFLYAPSLFRQLIKHQVEVYPLEDTRQFALLAKETSGSLDAPVITTARNKSWVRVMAAKMAEIRQTDPDALFIVYAGQAHTSWLSPMALPKFFAAEKPVVVELALNRLLDHTSLKILWPSDDPLFINPPLHPSFFSWQGEDSRQLANCSGFDYLLVVPGE